MQSRRLAAPALELVSDPVQSAKVVGLRYVSDQISGIRRVKVGRNFRYIGPDGKAVRDVDTLRRIKSLVIPPAWTQVWICPYENGHLQATGRDVKGRKQYRYHPRWRTVRDETKYTRMIEFGKALPAIRGRVQKDMDLPGLPREKVLATLVRLLEVSLIRVGNEEYARANRSFGLTTLRDQHVEVSGSTLHFAFRGKAGKRHQIDVNDPRLARIVKKCQDLPGQELFQYLDGDGSQQTIGSSDVNQYLKEVSGQEFTAKDFRTWAGTVLAARALQELEQFDSQTMAKKNIVRAIEAVSQMLGNTPSICRKCYVHPAVLESYLDGVLVSTLRRRADKALTTSLSHLKPEEAAVLAFLERRLADEEDKRPATAKARPSSRPGGSRLRSGSHRLRNRIPASWR